jgi:hypothetical protein
MKAICKKSLVTMERLRSLTYPRTLNVRTKTIPSKQQSLTNVCSQYQSRNGLYIVRQSLISRIRHRTHARSSARWRCHLSVYSSTTPPILPFTSTTSRPSLPSSWRFILSIRSSRSWFRSGKTTTKQFRWPTSIPRLTRPVT